MIELVALVILIHCNTLMKFAHAVLARVPSAASHNAEAIERIVAVTGIAAQRYQIEIKRLPA